MTGAKMDAFALAAGSVIARRFHIERAAGAGGMGAVYRATDGPGGAPVAVKLLLRGAQAAELERFQREIRAVSELRHPAIVAYVAHGVAEGRPFLAMEWLEGEDLAARLRRQRLGSELGMRLALRVSEGLAVAHRHGVVHRDIKPSNIFLRGGEADGATLIDFGIARRRRGEPMITRTGVLLGTPEYMAPEQARGEADIGPAADVFSLGCVLFECLTGQTPFRGEHVTAVLARILFDEAPRLRTLRPDLPAELDTLLARMLAREPGERLPDGAAVLTALRDLPTLGDRVGPSRTLRPRETGGEQSFFSVVVASDATTFGERATLQAVPVEPGDDLTRALRDLGAEVEPLLDGSLAAAFPPVRGLAPGDRAALAVRCALLVKERRPDLLVAVATGRGVLAEGLPRGEGIERAVGLLRAAAPPELVRADALTAELVSTRFELRALAPGLVTVIGERASLDESRPLLGRPTPCVGREQELGALEGALAASVDEQSARVVVVRAAPGMGKSRLRHEFLRRAAVRVPDLDVLFGRADLMRAGAAYGVVASALRQRWGLHPGDDPAQARRKLGDALAGALPAEVASQVGEFFAEMCGVPPDDPGPRLRAARREPKLMLEQQTEAFVALLRAACERAPVLLVLEDLHWGDAPSFALIDAALKALVDRPLLVVGFARPEVDEQFAGLWRERGVLDLRLAGLSRRAAERLIHHTLGPELDAAALARLLDHAGGNPLYLEELIRASAAGQRDEVPDTVLAMMHTRLLGFDARQRRVLRAAASFGEVFWRGGLISMLVDEVTAAEVDACLPALVEHELIVRTAASRIPGEDEYAFRHALLREAAYSLSGPDDRARDHRGAAEFLERIGERDPRILAEHWCRAGERERAAVHLLAAAETSYRACDREAVDALVDRGLACEPVGEVRAGFHAISALLHVWRLDWVRSQAAAAAAVEHAEPGSLWWCRAMMTLLNLSFYGGHLRTFTPLAERYLAHEPCPAAEAVYLEGLANFISYDCMLGDRAPADRCCERMQRLGARHLDDLGAQAGIAAARSDYHRSLDPNPALQLAEARRALDLYVAVGDRRGVFFAEVSRGQAEAELGLVAAGEATLRAALADAERLGDAFFVTMSAAHLAALLAWRTDADGQAEAVALIERLLAIAGLSPGFRCWSHIMLANIRLARGELDAAGEHIVLAAQAPATNIVRLRLVAAAHMRLLLARGELTTARALALAEAPYIARGCGHAEMPLRLAIALVLRAAGEPEAAAELLRATIAELGRRAATLPDPAARERYLAGVPIHAEARALARAWALEL